MKAQGYKGPKSKLIASMDKFTRAYIEAILFGETDSKGNPLDARFDAWDFSTDALKKCIEDCTKFQSENVGRFEGYTLEQSGHDFYFTRNGHGVGYWENDYGTEENNDVLTKSAKRFGEMYTYIHNGLIRI